MRFWAESLKSKFDELAGERQMRLPMGRKGVIILHIFSFFATARYRNVKCQCVCVPKTSSGTQSPPGKELRPCSWYLEEPQRSQAPPLPMKKRGAAVGQLYWWLPRFPSGCTTILGELRMQRGMNMTDSTVNKSIGWFAIRLYTKSKALSASLTQWPAWIRPSSALSHQGSPWCWYCPLSIEARLLVAIAKPSSPACKGHSLTQLSAG